MMFTCVRKVYLEVYVDTAPIFFVFPSPEQSLFSVLSMETTIIKSAIYVEGPFKFVAAPCRLFT